MSGLVISRSLSHISNRTDLYTSSSMRSSLPSIMSPSPSKKTPLNLPQIRHPLSVRAESKASDLDIRGSQCSANYQTHRSNVQESAHHQEENSESFCHTDTQKPKEKRQNETPFSINSIPEGVEVTFGDPKKIRLPVFGNASRLSGSIENGNTTSRSAQARIEVDEIEMLLRNRVNRQNLTKIKKRFKDNDPDGRGFVSREALHRIIITLVKKVFSQTIFVRLLSRLGLCTKSCISIKEFWRSLHSDDEENSFWLDPIQRHNHQNDSDSAIHYDSPRSATNPKLESNENGNPVSTTRRPDSLAEGNDKNRNQVVYSPRKIMAKHKKATNIEKWLKMKFREGFKNMKQEFENRESEHKELVTFDHFLEVLSLFGLHLEKPLLRAFLSRCGVKPRPEGVPYRDFLHRFQDRSEAGMTHQVLANTKHRFHKDPHMTDKENNESPRRPNRPITSLSLAETRLVHLFQKDFLLLLGILKSCDVLEKGSVPAGTFRKILKEQYGFDFSDNGFNRLMENLPLDKNGDVKYVDLMKQFDTRCPEPSLFKEKMNGSVITKDTKTQVSPSLSPKRSESPEIRTNKENTSPNNDCNVKMSPARRSQQQLYMIIRSLINQKYRKVEEAFYEIDEANSGRLTQEMTYQLLRKFDIIPKITRGEIRSLWEMCITNMDHTLDFHEFVRHFSFSPKTASYPNAKICPPVKGDADFMMRSKKLNCASDMLRDGLRAKIDYMWEDLQREFLGMDPYRTGFVSKEEFQEVVTELCPHISDYELEILTRRFQEEADKRISYVQFLKPFAMKHQPWRYGKNMFSLLHQANSTEKKPIPQKKALDSNLKHKLTSVWKNLRHAFHKVDKENSGVVPLPEFNAILKKNNIVLDNEEKYQLLDKFDEKLSGKFAYEKFLKEIMIP